MSAIDFVGDAQFVSATYRLFKGPQDKPSEQGSTVVYKGTWENC